MEEVVFQPLAPYQQPDCLRPGCPNPAVQEAAISKGNVVAGIRCCNNQQCMDYARGLALESLRLALRTNKK